MVRVGAAPVTRGSRARADGVVSGLGAGARSGPDSGGRVAGLSITVGGSGGGWATAAPVAASSQAKAARRAIP